MVPQIVVFDLGKVLVDFDFNIAARKIAEKSLISLSDLYVLVCQSPLILRYESGELTNEQFYQGVCDGTGYSGSFEEFSVTFADIFTPIDSMIDLHAQLRAREIPTYIFSNTNDLAVSHIRKHFPFFTGFDGYIYSFEQRVMKPDPKLYQVLEKISGRSGPQILYIDDRLENTETGNQRGWQTIHHISPERTIDTMRALGLLD